MRMNEPRGRCGKHGGRGDFYLRRVFLFSSEGDASFRKPEAPVLERDAATGRRKSPPDSEFSQAASAEQQTFKVQPLELRPPAISMFINTGLANKLQPCMWRLRSADRRAHADQPRSGYAVSPAVGAGQKKTDLFGDLFGPAAGSKRAVSTDDPRWTRG